MTDAVIFDIDGTLLDSVDLHAQAWQEAFEQFGRRFELDKIREQIGKGGDQLLPVFLTPREIDSIGKELEEFRGKLFKEKYLCQVKPFPGVRDLFKKVLANKQKIALASSGKKDEVEKYEKIAGIDDLVDVKTSSGDAEKSKPHPDIFEVALERLGDDIERNRTVVVGDSPYDAQAATKAKVRAVGVLCGGFSEESLQQAGCVAIYRDLEDLLKNYDRSPLAKN